MFMRYWGGSVGHNRTREAMNKFLLNCDWLDMSNNDVDEEDDIGGLNNDEHRIGHSPKDNEDASSDASDKDDEGCVLGGDNVEADGAAEDWEIGFEGDEADDYTYRRPVEDSDNSDNSEAEPDNTDNVLGPEDGEGESDETYLLGFVAL